MRIILFNGPSGVGKDTAVRALFRKFGPIIKPEKLSLPAKLALAAICNYTLDTFGDIVELPDPESKLVPQPRLAGMSARQWQIDFCESFMKPKYGNNIFARLFLSRLDNYNSDAIVAVSDCGFSVEADTVRNSKHITQLIQLHRGGRDFTSDSREFVPLFHARDARILNNYSSESSFSDYICQFVAKEFSL